MCVLCCFVWYSYKLFAAVYFFSPLVDIEPHLVSDIHEATSLSHYICTSSTIPLAQYEWVCAAEYLLLSSNFHSRQRRRRKKIKDHNENETHVFETKTKICIHPFCYLISSTFDCIENDLQSAEQIQIDDETLNFLEKFFFSIECIDDQNIITIIVIFTVNLFSQSLFLCFSFSLLLSV